MQFDKRAWLERFKKMFAGFDRPLALIVFLLLCVGVQILWNGVSALVTGLAKGLAAAGR